MDVFTPEKRSEIMSRIRGTNTQPERFVKAVLWAKGFRFARSSYGLAGKPDIILPRYHTVIFVHGCFWHGHCCKKGRLPTSNAEYWRQKIEGNVRRDLRVIRTLRKQGWHCFQVWQCRLAADTNRVATSLQKMRVF